MTAIRQRTISGFENLWEMMTPAMRRLKQALTRREARFLPEALISLTLLIGSWILVFEVGITLPFHPKIFTWSAAWEICKEIFFISGLLATEYALFLADEPPSELRRRIRIWWRKGNPITGTISVVREINARLKEADERDKAEQARRVAITQYWDRIFAELRPSPDASPAQIQAWQVVERCWATRGVELSPEDIYGTLYRVSNEAIQLSAEATRLKTSFEVKL